ncbi:MAG: hypothetical protein AMJ79_12575 [Phycisphaerae bacterium SM23_30]|nr:MAG: hypothetical protein AMJ79_12575 [Phycisphaerae bacterium SM23_30]
MRLIFAGNKGFYNYNDAFERWRSGFFLRKGPKLVKKRTYPQTTGTVEPILRLRAVVFVFWGVIFFALSPAGGQRPVLLEPNQVSFPVIQPLGRWELMSELQPDGSRVVTYTGGVLVIQRRPAEETILTLKAQNAVAFLPASRPIGGGQGRVRDPNQTEMERLSEAVSGIYLEGDVVMETGDFGIGERGNFRFTAEKLYYDFVHQRALGLDGVLRLELPDPAIPFYVRAQRIRQLSEYYFRAEELKLSNDEFYQPHVWLGASRADIAAVDAAGGVPSRLSEIDHYRFDLRDVTANLEDLPVFYWPQVKGDNVGVDAPLSSVRTGYSSIWGLSFESEWDLASLFGLPQPPGYDSVLRIDEFTKRGPAGGVELDYTHDFYRGNLRSYIVDDKGEDRLGRYDLRHDIEPTRPLRGRARWQHRQFLPLDWQGTVEISYLSDPTFLESWEEREFDTDKEQETLIYLKQQRDQWAFDFLSKWSLNDFEYTMKELPTAGFHVAGQDLFDIFTYYHNGFVSRVSERAGDREVPGLSGSYEPWALPYFTDQRDHAFAVSRHELSLPIHLWGFNIAPTVIGTYVYDDAAAADSFVQGAGGVRASTQFHRIDNSVKSRLWDLDRVRHIIVPEVSAFWVDSDQTETEPYDVFNFSVRQRWQTKRGAEGAKRSVDFLRFNAQVTLVGPDEDDVGFPNKFFFSAPEPQFGMQPFMNADFMNLGLARRERINQSLASHTTCDWSWLISDTTAFLGGVNYNMNDGVVSQAYSSLAVQRGGRTSYYIGDFYLRDADAFRDTDGHFLTAGLSYRLNRKYSFSLAHQFDVERTVDTHTQLALVREFPHWFGAFVVNLDPARDRYSFSVSFWPAGYDKIALGARRFARLGW